MLTVLVVVLHPAKGFVSLLSWLLILVKFVGPWQVIEISSIPEHLLEECQNRENYTECEISHLAIRIEDLDKWQRSKSCKPPGKGE